MRKRLSGVLIAVVAVVAAVFGAQSPARAEDRGSNWVEQLTASGYCRAWIDTTLNSAGSVVAYAEFDDLDPGWTCEGWLERSTDGGKHWYIISGYHLLDSVPVVESDSTGTYYDGVGYLARACFQFTFSGAATHCTYGV